MWKEKLEFYYKLIDSNPLIPIINILPWSKRKAEEKN